MICIKTGFTAYITDEQLLLYGDAFQLSSPYNHAMALRNPDDMNNWLLLRICSKEDRVKDIPPINILTKNYDHWWDIKALNSTMLIRPGAWEWLSYEGTVYDPS